MMFPGYGQCLPPQRILIDMPHVNIEFSCNVQAYVDMNALCELMRSTAATIEALPMPGIRVRANAVKFYAIADGSPSHGFIDIVVRLRGGRPLPVRKAAVQTLFEAARQFLEPVMTEHSLALSMEMRDIDPELSPKIGTIRDHL